MTAPQDVAANAYKAVRNNIWTERLARFGLAAKGAVYLLIGVLAIQFARGERGNAADPQNALLSISDESFGPVLLVALAVGLFGYALWCAAQAFFDPQRDGSDAKGLYLRAGKLLKSIVYGGLAIFALKLGLGEPARAEGKEALTASALAMPFGELLVFLAGLFLIGYGGYQIYLGYTGGFLKDISGWKMARLERGPLVALGKVGHISRGIIFGIFGGLVIKAAVNSNPRHARSVEGAIDALAGYGLLLGFVAVGVAAYGLYHLLAARHWRIEV